ncbi:Alkylated DNA repair protein alkB -like protein 8 [Ceratocystis fimbriata CBS 114723]|uniref:Alkylated DNA repair protein alkB-like protein 8 n=2 Tax=Ceratocystis TaxID=5157 RepID=A0A2C5X1T0_9PEZI|nr:Alkylated DNA repair protein alkB -like protein 8 [Ceratocystis fimbriata CBS 114723]
MEPLDTEPCGILMQPNFITADHEAELIDIFRTQLSWPERRGRLSLHYGYTFSYQTFGIDPKIPFIPFPAWLLPLLPTTEGRPPDQVCLQHYSPGTGIPPHVDTHSAFDQLYALSLGAPVIMQFKNGSTGVVVDIDLSPRSLIQMSGDSRLHWTHGIRARKTDVLGDGEIRKRGDRWSLTYRWLRPGATCSCGDLKLCDTAQREAGIEKEYRWQVVKEGANDTQESNGKIE